MARITPTLAITEPWKMPTGPVAGLFRPEHMSRAAVPVINRPSASINNVISLAELCTAESRADRLLHCREGYRGAAAALAHLKNVGELLQKFLQTCELMRLEVHGPSEQFEKLRPALTTFPVEFFELQIGFRR